MNVDIFKFSSVSNYVLSKLFYFLKLLFLICERKIIKLSYPLEF